MRYVFFDLETTGLNPYASRVIEYGACDAVGCEYSTLVRQPRPLPRFIVELTGLTDADLATGASPADAALGFMTFIGTGPVTLVAHNAEFDAVHLACELRAVGIEPPPNVQWADSMRVFQYTHPGERRSRLADMARVVLNERGFVTSHRAIDDARVVHRAMHTMCDGDIDGVLTTVHATLWPRL